MHKTTAQTAVCLDLTAKALLGFVGMTKPLTIIGTMSGTAMDGIDVALLTTDGERLITPGCTAFYSYTPEFRSLLRGILGGADQVAVAPVERELTRLHLDAVRNFILTHNLRAEAVDYIALHGHTILHDPKNRRTWQIGCGAFLAKEMGIPVVYDFRSADVAAGGHGAPLVPIFHAALAADLPGPVVLVNIGGVANVTFVGADGALLAFDTGPGNALLDDWMLRKTGRLLDQDGAMAKSGTVDQARIDAWLADAYFKQPAPKSLDRNRFVPLLAEIDAMTTADGAATLAAFTASAITTAAAHLPEVAKSWLICGGGRHNQAVMRSLQKRLPQVRAIDQLGWDGDFIEAWAFAYLAARRVRNLPISFPTTTGVPQPMTGGMIVSA
jgi:anhydro-N-acetylmuramic acid kinase